MIRIIVESSNIATNKPNPICCIINISPKANPPKTATIISPAPVIIVAVELNPYETASVLSFVLL